MSDRQKVAAGHDPMELRAAADKLRTLAGKSTRLDRLAKATSIDPKRLAQAARGELELTERELKLVSGHPLL